MLRLRQVALIEDDAATAEVMTRYIERYNFDVAHIQDSRKAPARLSENAFDLIILDLMMPHADGFNVLGALRKTPGFNVPVLIASARHDKEAIMEIKSLGAAGYLAKPIEPITLLEKIKSALSLADAELIDRTKNIFSQRVWQDEDRVVRIDFSGIPTAASLSVITDGIIAAQRMVTNTRELALNVPEMFCLNRSHYSIFKQMAQSAQKIMKFGRLNTRVTGDYLKRLDPAQMSEIRKIAKIGNSES